MGTGGSFTEADHSPSYNGDVKSVWSSTSIPKRLHGVENN